MQIYLCHEFGSDSQCVDRESYYKQWSDGMTIDILQHTLVDLRLGNECIFGNIKPILEKLMLITGSTIW